jgi:two-component system cell cycle response regulator
LRLVVSHLTLAMPHPLSADGRPTSFAFREHPRSASSLPPHREPRVLIVDESPWRRLAIANLLEAEGYQLLDVSPRDDVLAAVASFEPDLILLDEAAADASEGTLSTQLREVDSARDLSIILLARSALDEETATSALLAGVDDYICALERPNELRARLNVQVRNKRSRDALTRVRRERDQFRTAATLDPLTGVPNRGALEQELLRRIARREPFAVLFLDLDHFKSINDRFGHATGDHVLRRTAGLLQRSIRPEDACGRYGGEELVVISAATTPEGAMQMAERHRAAIEALTFPELGQPTLTTASIGVALYEVDNESLEELVTRADAAMYEAKLLGRNRVAFSSPEAGPLRVSGIRLAYDPEP